MPSPGKRVGLSSGSYASSLVTLFQGLCRSSLARLTEDSSILGRFSDALQRGSLFLGADQCEPPQTTGTRITEYYSTGLLEGGDDRNQPLDG